MNWILNKLISWIIPTEIKPFSDARALEVLEKANQIPDFAELLDTMANNDIKIYFKYPEKQSELRMLRKGMMWRTKTLADSMKSATKKLDKLNKKNDT